MQINSSRKKRAEPKKDDGARHKQQLKVFRLNYRRRFALGFEREIIEVAPPRVSSSSGWRRERGRWCVCVPRYLDNIIISSSWPISANDALYCVVVSRLFRPWNFWLVLRKTGTGMEQAHGERDVILMPVPDASRCLPFEQTVLFVLHFNHAFFFRHTSLFPSA